MTSWRVSIIDFFCLFFFSLCVFLSKNLSDFVERFEINFLMTSMNLFNWVLLFSTFSIFYWVSSFISVRSRELSKEVVDDINELKDLRSFMMILWLFLILESQLFCEERVNIFKCLNSIIWIDQNRQKECFLMDLGWFKKSIIFESLTDENSGDVVRARFFWCFSQSLWTPLYSWSPYFLDFNNSI